MMKKQMSLILALTAVGMISSVQAQSVTLYGRVDLGVSKESGDTLGGRAWQVNNGMGSTLGVRGTEDLGGGLKASFNFEHQFDASTGKVWNPDPQIPGTGPDSKFWDRRAVVSLSGSFGEITLGREASPVFVQGVLVDPFTWDHVSCQCGGGVLVAANPSGGAPYIALATIANIGTVRYDNSITYATPTFSNMVVKAQVAMAEGKPGSKTSYALAWDYGHHFAQNLALSLGYERNGTVASPGGMGSYFIAGGGYRFGDGYRVTGSVSSGKLDAGDKTRNFMLGAQKAFGASTVSFSYDRFKNSGALNWNMNKWVAGYGYDLSKRTSLYTNVSRTQGNGKGPIGASTSSWDAGITHNF